MYKWNKKDLEQYLDNKILSGLSKGERRARKVKNGERMNCEVGKGESASLKGKEIFCQQKRKTSAGRLQGKTVFSGENDETES